MEAPNIAPPSIVLLPPDEPKRRRTWLYVLLGICAIFLAITAYLGVTGYRLAMALHDVQRSGQSTEQALRAGNMRAAFTASQSMHEAMSRAKSAVSGLRFAQAIPVIGPHIRVANGGVESAELGLSAASEALEALASLQESFDRLSGAAPTDVSRRAFKDLTREEKRAFLTTLDATMPQLRAARQKALIAIDRWESIPRDGVSPALVSVMDEVTTHLEDARRYSATLLDLASLALPLGGYPEPKTYVFALQNSDELRPTGGFLGTMGVMRFDSGEITDQTVQDVYAYDRASSSSTLGEPPVPLARELGTRSWFIRDSNWSPDVPQSAERILGLFDAQGFTQAGVASVPVAQADGMIFFGSKFFEELLTITGPITAGGMTFQADTFFDQLQYAVEVGFAQQGIPVEERKKIVGTLGTQLLDTILSLPASQWPQVLDALDRAFTRKDVMFVLRDPALMRTVDARGWTGRVRGAKADELWVVDANLAALKTDRVMNKEVRYSVDATNPDRPVATVTLHYTNTNKVINWRFTRYRDYVRLYVPEGSELLGVDGAMARDLSQTGGVYVPGTVDVMKDLGKTVFGAFWSVEPGETRDITFRYVLPPRVSQALREGSYQLLLSKQPGARRTYSVDVALPRTVRQAVPAEASAEYGDSRYRVSLPVDRDQLIDVSF